MNFSDLCTPAMIYFVISIITLIISIFSSFNIMSILIKGIFIMLWAWLLNFLCSKGYSIVSWILVVLPFITMIM